MAFSISALYDEGTGTAPLKWGENAVADGVFSADQGRVVIDDEVVQTIVSWTDSKIVFVPNPAGRTDGSYTVHIDNIPGVSAPIEYLHDFARGNPITLGGFNGTPTDGVYTDPDHRPSDATGADSAGVIQTVTSNVPVIVGGSLSGNIWSEAAGTHGLQLEESRTNYCRWSEWPSGGGKGTDWQSRGSGFIGDGYPSPDGGNNAARIAISGSSTNDIWFSRAIGIGTDIPYEIYVHIRYVDGPNFEMRHANGAAGGQWNIDVTKLPQGEWARVNKDHEAVTVATPFNTRAGNGSIHFYNTSATTVNMDIYSVQLEGDVAFTTSYIKTSGTPVTRAATVCSGTFTQLGDPLPAGGFTNDFCGQLSLQLKFASTVTGDTTLFSIGDATNGIAILINGTTLTLRKYVGGSPANLTLTTAAYAAGDDVDIRYRISASDMKLWWNVATTNANANGTALAAAASTATLEPGNVIAHQCRILPTAADDTAIGNWETWSPPS